MPKDYHQRFRERFPNLLEVQADWDDGRDPTADILSFIDEVVADIQVKIQTRDYDDYMKRQAEHKALIEKLKEENKPCKHEPDTLCINCGRSWLARDLLTYLRDI